MADVAPDLAADLLAAFSSVHGMVPPSQSEDEPALSRHGIADMLAEDKVEAVTTARESEAVEPTASPPKRPRTTEHEAEGCAGKRQKTEHGLPADLAPDPGAPSWDISAMIQNALGSLDRQLDPRTQEADHGDGAPQTTQPPLTTTADAAATAIATATASATATPTPTPTPHTTATAAPAATSTATTGARKPEQRRMKFSSNPYYVMRTMSLPLLGSLVSSRCHSRPQAELNNTILIQRVCRPCRSCSLFRSSLGRRPWRLSPTRSRNTARLTTF